MLLTENKDFLGLILLYNVTLTYATEKTLEWIKYLYFIDVGQLFVETC